jgi:hypothetical protein
MAKLALDIATSTGWAVLCDGDLTARLDHARLFAGQKLRRHRVAWASYPETDQTLIYGFWDLGASKESGFGFAAAKLLACLLELNKFVPIEYIYWEQRFPSQNFHTTDVLATLAGAVAIFCHNRRPRIAKHVENRDWAPHFIGHIEHRQAKRDARERKKQGDERASARPKLKSLSMERARAYGLTVQRDDESDAIGILDYSLLVSLKIKPPWRLDEVLQPILYLEAA